MSTGYLELIAGPMFSGKTSLLLQLHKQFSFCNIPMLVINYAEDTRYSTQLMSSHDKVMIPCTLATALLDVADLRPGLGPAFAMATSNATFNAAFNAAQVILINEGQFFKDIVEWTKLAVEQYNKRVYICGLDGDFQRERFGRWLELIPFCDKFTKLHSFCSICKVKPAIFSRRLGAETAQKMIGADNYLPLCRGCYLVD